MTNLYTTDAGLSPVLTREGSDSQWIQAEMVEECFEGWDLWTQNVFPRARRDREATRLTPRDAEARWVKKL